MNRVSEISAFDLAISSLRGSLKASDLSPVEDRRAPRRNVLSYYGVGGIGKSTLSRELENRFVEPGSGGGVERAAIRVDFSESQALDPETYVLRLRAGMAQLARSWPAFDLAIATYWARAHPGEPLDEFINRDSALRRASRATALSEQIHTTISELASVLPGVAGGAYRLASSIYGQAREALSAHRTLKRCELLPELLDADADLETLSYFPYLLAWDLDRIPRLKPQVAVFLDTYEAVGGAAWTDRAAERWLQRSIFLMPNVLFVITGRNRLDWAELNRPEVLDFIGEERWPNLGSDPAGEPRQHLVGYLSETDAAWYLDRAITRDDQPAISPEIRNKIVEAAAGLPLYLDLAATTYLDLIARNKTPTVDDFGQPLPTVAARMLRDLGADEQQLLRTAAMLNSFDLEILRAGCPNVPDAALRRFRDRPFLQVDPDRTWRYSLHAVLREAIRDADAELPDSWSPRERAMVATRLAAGLEAAASAAAAAGDRSTEIAAFREAADLGTMTDQFFEWLVDLAQRLLASGYWSSLRDQRDGPVQLRALGLGIESARERRAGDLNTAMSTAQSALDLVDQPRKLHDFLRLHRAHALRVAGKYEQAATDYWDLTEPAGPFSSDARYWIADYDYLDGRFNDALTGLDAIENRTDLLQGEILRLRGHIFRVNALLAQAEASYREALELARNIQVLAAEGKALTDLVQTLAWQRPDDALDLLATAKQTNEGVQNSVELVKLHAATAVAHAQRSEFEAAEHEIETGLELTHRIGYPGGSVWCWSARALNRARQADQVGHRHAISQLTSIVQTIHGNRFWRDIARWLADMGLDDIPSNTVWLDGEEITRNRWASIGVRG